jgi:hypothetical protein
MKLIMFLVAEGEKSAYKCLLILCGEAAVHVSTIVDGMRKGVNLMKSAFVLK